MIGDKVLIESEIEKRRIKSGAYPPTDLHENERILREYRIKNCQFIPLHPVKDGDESWNSSPDETTDLSRQIKVEENAVFCSAVLGKYLLNK
jgi:hypothetical protein